MGGFPLTGDALALLRRLGISGAAGVHERAVSPDTIDTLAARGLIRTDRGRLLLTAAGRAALNAALTARRHVGAGARAPTIVTRAAAPTIQA